MGFWLLEANLPSASVPAAIFLIWLLTMVVWTGLACSHLLSQGEPLLSALPRGFEIVRQRAPSALRLTTSQLAILAFPGSVALGLMGPGPLRWILFPPGVLILCWVWVGWMLWGIREQELPGKQLSEIPPEGPQAPSIN
jgi:hypothetical protein